MSGRVSHGADVAFVQTRLGSSTNEFAEVASCKMYSAQRPLFCKEPTFGSREWSPRLARSFPSSDHGITHRSDHYVVVLAARQSAERCAAGAPEIRRHGCADDVDSESSAIITPTQTCR